MNITFTGLDARTTQAEVEDLLDDPRVELGVLYTTTPEGRNRYPNYAQACRLIEWCKGRGAVHICGKGARLALFDGEIDNLIAPARRIQINGMNLSIEEVERYCVDHPDHYIITQWPSTARLSGVVEFNHAFLVDGSGGRGQIPGQWERPITEKQVGFAGGLGPDTIEAQLPLIRAVAIEPFWIDMEGQVRTDDWFDVRKCLKVLELIGNT